MSIKIAHYLAQVGIASRRKSEELVAQGKVQVNGEIETNVATRIDPEKDAITYLGEPLSQKNETILLALNKPYGVVSTVSDPDGARTVLDCVPQEFKKYRLFPMGRLDKESEGLILLTNDGDLAYQTTHPKFELGKLYRVTINGILTGAEVRRLRSGVPLKDGKTRRANVEVIDEGEDFQVLEMELHEGRNRQIRRMIKAMNHEVLRLVRIKIGPYELGELKSGQIRKEDPKKLETFFNRPQ